jgi:tetratricopeptide (TPR) repeat protein
MTRLTSSDIAHTANTDHRVLRRPDGDDHDPARRPPPGPGWQPMVHFHRDRVPPDDPDAARDRGIAFAQFAVDLRDAEAARQALLLLDAALHDWPDDIAALEVRASALAAAGRISDGLATYETVLAKAPKEEAFVLRAAALAERMGRQQQAAEFYRRAVALNPAWAGAYVGLARADMARLKWADATGELEIALQMNPFDVAARQLLVGCCLQTGDQKRARQEVRRLLAFNPPNRRAWRDWLEREERARPGPGP